MEDCLPIDIGGVAMDAYNGRSNIYQTVGSGFYSLATDSAARSEAWSGTSNYLYETFTDSDKFGQRVGAGGLVTIGTFGVGRVLEGLEAISAAATSAKTTGALSDGLSTSVRASFAGGKYTPWVADSDTILYRGENMGQGAGRFFGLEKPLNSLEAETMYKIKMWGNNATQLGAYNIPAGTRGFIGGVEGGSGMQIFFPNTTGVQLLDQTTLFTSELKFISP